MRLSSSVKEVYLLASLAAFAIFSSGCTEPGETTGIGAAAGGVLGAGLGAIVGNQTGNPGSGLVLGAAAGAGTGAMIANAFQAQEERLRAQDEALERQDQVLQAQKSEMEELRRMNQGGDYSRPTKNYQYSKLNSSRTKSRPSAPLSSTNESQIAQNRTRAFSSSLDSSPNQGIDENQLAMKNDAAKLETNAASRQRASYNWNKTSESSEKKNAISKISNTQGSSECGEAQDEVNKANEAIDSADKLFHLRRALRLCPNNSSYHNMLGGLYLKLGRKEDADFEFGEARRIGR